MAQRGGQGPDLPSFFKNNPWLDILAQRGTELDFMTSSASSSPAACETTPATETESITGSLATPVMCVPGEFVMKFELPSELVKAIKELKETIVMALSASQRQATIIPIYIPINVAQLAHQTIHASILTQGLEENRLICPKCGRPGKLSRARKGKRTYIIILHGRQKCYLGLLDRVKEKWPHLLQRKLSEIDNGQPRLVIQSCLVPLGLAGLNMGEGLYPSSNGPFTGAGVPEPGQRGGPEAPVA